MQMYAFKHTEAGANRRMMARLETEQAKREVAESAARKLMVEVAKKEDELRQAVERLKYPVFRSAFRTIEERAMRVFKISRQMLYSNRRYKEIVLARQFIMYWAVRRTTLSLPQIGRLMGGRDHTTVIHGREIYPVKRETMGRYLRPVR
jgi:chromosomal replication initiation ATPase DnaA